MNYKTRDFGEVEIEELKVIEMVQPIFGFDEYKKYTLLHDEEMGTDITWLQSLEEQSLRFILLDPASFAPDYAPAIPDAVAKMLGDGALDCRVIAAIPRDFKKTTVNMKSPIVINVDTRKGAQIILEQDYPVRCPLMKDGE